MECAGACYRPKATSQTSISSASSITSLNSLTGDVSTNVCLSGGPVSQASGGAGGREAGGQNQSHYGVRDAALFPGYEVYCEFCGRN